MAPTTPQEPGLSAVPSYEEQQSQSRFDALIGDDSRIEPRDWMPEPYPQDAHPSDLPACALRNYRNAAGG